MDDQRLPRSHSAAGPQPKRQPQRHGDAENRQDTSPSRRRSAARQTEGARRVPFDRRGGCQRSHLTSLAPSLPSPRLLSLRVTNPLRNGRLRSVVIPIERPVDHDRSTATLAAQGAPCLRASVPPCLRASVPPCLRASVPPCLRASVPPCLRASVPPCLRASVPPWPTRSSIRRLASRSYTRRVSFRTSRHPR